MVLLAKLKIYFYQFIYLKKKLNNNLKKSNNKMSDKKNLYFFKECYLINSKCLSEFKLLFLYEFII